jgi:hypothetical protein
MCMKSKARCCVRGSKNGTLRTRQRDRDGNFAAILQQLAPTLLTQGPVGLAVSKALRASGLGAHYLLSATGECSATFAGRDWRKVVARPKAMAMMTPPARNGVFPY